MKKTVGDASIFFEASDSVIFSETACYTVRWEVSGIEGVYLNDGGKIGTGEERLCYDDVQQPELRVVFEDGTDKTYQLDITLVLEVPNFLIVIGIAILLVFFSLYFLIAPLVGVTLRTRKATIRAIANLVLITVLSFMVVGGVLSLRFVSILPIMEPNWIASVTSIPKMIFKNEPRNSQACLMSILYRTPTSRITIA